MVAVEHVDNAYNGLKHYFDVLELNGSYPEYDTLGMLVYSFIVDQIFSGPLYEYLDETGLSSIRKALSCLYRHGCLLQNPDTIRLSTPHGFSYDSLLRATEDVWQRYTEGEEPRRVE